jgi:hypothetical protein
LGQGAGTNQTTGSGNVYIGVGVPVLLARAIAATSQASSTKCLPAESHFSLMQAISSVRPALLTSRSEAAPAWIWHPPLAYPESGPL